MNDRVYQGIDLFAGAGGFSLGMKLAGLDITHAVEKDLWAAETYKANHQRTEVLCQDICSMNEDKIGSILDSTKVDFIIGGPPCQGFSVASSRRHSNDPRNSLFRYFLDWVKILRPKIFAIENVKGILNRKILNGENATDIIKYEIRDLGYSMEIWVVNAVNYGVPQKRERVFIIGHVGDLALKVPEATHSMEPNEIGLEPCITVWDAISDLSTSIAKEDGETIEYKEKPQSPYQNWARLNSQGVSNHVSMKHTSRMIQRFESLRNGSNLESLSPEIAVRKRSKPNEVSSSIFNMNYRILEENEPSYTIPASFYSSFIHPRNNRNITAREAARLQSFPDSYIFKGRRTMISSSLLKRKNQGSEDYLSQYCQIGNAVPPLLGAAVGKEIRYYLDRTINSNNDY